MSACLAATATHPSITLAPVKRARKVVMVIGEIGCTWSVSTVGQTLNVWAISTRQAYKIGCWLAPSQTVDFVDMMSILGVQSVSRPTARILSILCLRLFSCFEKYPIFDNTHQSINVAFY